jgi:hypothetical protein
MNGPDTYKDYSKSCKFLRLAIERVVYGIPLDFVKYVF